MVNNYSCNLDNDYISHYGILGMKWGVRRYQNKDGTLTTAGIKRLKETTIKTPTSYDKEMSTISKRDAGIKEGKDYDVISKGAKFGRIANSGEKVGSRRKYVYLTKEDSRNYSEMFDALGIDMSRPISTYEYSASKNLKVKHADEVVKDAVKKYGDVSIKQLYDNDLLDISTDYHKSYYNIEKMNDNERFVKEQSEKGRKWLYDIMKDHGQDLLSDYKKEGFDAVIDPEDINFAEYPVILIEPKSSIKMNNEAKWN